MVGKSQKRVDEIVQAASTLFRTKGYAATSMDDVRECAGVSKGGLYHHFSSKEHLLRAVIVQVNRETARRLERDLARRTDTGAARLQLFLDLKNKYRNDQLELFGALLHGDSDMVVESVVRTMWADYEPLLTHILSEIGSIHNASHTAHILAVLLGDLSLRVSRVSHLSELRAVIQNYEATIHTLVGVPGGTLCIVRSDFMTELSNYLKT